MGILAQIGAEFASLNVYVKTSVIIALALYPFLSWEILTGRSEQNLATFILWGMLDGIAAASLYMTGKGNWYLPAAYVAGCIVVITCLLIVRTWGWGWFETMCSVLVVICIAGWAASGPRMAAILSTVGVGLATLPVLKDTWLKPEKSPLILYSLFTIANAFSVAGGTEWSVEQRLYPSVCVVLCGMVALTACRRFSRRRVDYDLVGSIG